VDKHLQSVIDKVGRVDISFNAVGIPNPKTRTPLVELDLEQFSLPIATYTRSYFLTARLAARHMIRNTSGVIMTVTATPSRASFPLVWEAPVRRWRPWRRSLEVYPSSSHLRVFAWSVCGHRGCRNQAGSTRSPG
jgi:NAD(P)-dependent dehydrogenase (short-subunit alcohol dehydrogenase family)